MKLPSMRQRLYAALLVASGAWALAVAAAVGLVVHHEVDDLLDHTLQESAELLLGLMRFHRPELPLGLGGAMPAPPHTERLIWQVVGRNNGVLLRSHNAPDQPLRPERGTGFTTAQDGWRVIGLPLDETGALLYVAQSAEERHEARLEPVLFAVGAAFLVGLGSALWLRSRMAGEFAHLRALSRSVQRFDPLRKGQTLAEATRSELEPMHHAIVELAARLAERVDVERAFAAHAAHALRTPLATMAANLAVAQQRASDEEKLPLQRTREAADRLQRVVTSLLTMFRSGGEVRRDAVRLDDIAAQLPFDDLRLVFDDDARLFVDPDLLTAALANILENAVRHGAREVRLEVLREGGTECLRVLDDGSGVDATWRRELQDAIDRQDYDGRTGLGLMLVDLVARAHGGRLTLLAPEAGFGLEMQLGA